MENRGFHFCMNCGSKLNPTDHFCMNCGVKVGEIKRRNNEIQKFVQYKSQIIDLKDEYGLKEKRAKELIDKLFYSSKDAYDKFNSSLNNSNKLFNEQADVTITMIDLATSESPFVEKEIKNKICILESLILKLNNLIDELVIHLSSSGDNSEEINNVFADMEELIDSVKYY